MGRPMTKRKWLAAIATLLAAVLVFGCGILLLRHGYHQYYTAVYPLEHQTLVENAAAEFQLPPSLIYAVIHTESSFEEGATSHADARGLMQLTDATFRWALSRAGETDRYTPEDLYDPAVNIHYGVYVLTLLGEQFDNTDTVLAAYNAGQGKVRDWLEDPAYSADGIHLDSIPYLETANYVQRVNTARRHYQTLYNME